MARKLKAPSLEDLQGKWDGLFDAINHGQDHVCAIVATSYVDHALGALLRQFFVDSGTAEGVLKPGAGAAGSLIAKAKVAYCLGFISKGCFQNIEHIADIRNAFAHSIDDVSFMDVDVVKDCDGLTLPHMTTNDEAGAARLRGWITQTARARFSFICQQICMYLTLEAINVTRRELRVDFWDQAPE